MLGYTRQLASRSQLAQLSVWLLSLKQHRSQLACTVISATPEPEHLNPELVCQYVIVIVTRSTSTSTRQDDILNNNKEVRATFDIGGGPLQHQQLVATLSVGASRCRVTCAARRPRFVTFDDNMVTVAQPQQSRPKLACSIILSQDIPPSDNYFFCVPLQVIRLFCSRMYAIDVWARGACDRENYVSRHRRKNLCVRASSPACTKSVSAIVQLKLHTKRKQSR